MPSEIKVVFGVAAFSTSVEKTTGGAAVTADRNVILHILNTLKQHGVDQLDNARIYAEGGSEEVLGELNYESLGFKVDTKVRSFFPGAHSPNNIHTSIEESLNALKTKKVNILYLHAPDRATPFEQTLEAINDSYKRGEFVQFGLSNYTVEQVEEIIEITKKRGWVQPTVYQGMYNLVARNNEEKLFPVLRKHNISFYAYSPLAGSFLTGQQTNQTATQGRFDPSAYLGQMYRDYYYKESYFKALEQIKEVAQKYNLAIDEIAFRWLNHHSLLKRENGDAIISGGKTPKYIESGLAHLEKPALPNEVVKVIQEIWQDIKAEAPAYHL